MMLAEHVPEVWDWHADTPVYCAVCRRVNNGDIQMVPWPCDAATAAAIVADLAAVDEPLEWGEYTMSCILCDGHGKHGYRGVVEPVQHADTCPWLRARQVVGGAS